MLLAKHYSLMFTLLTFLMSVYIHRISGESHFSQLSDGSTCTCPGDTLSVTYECTVTGGFGTVWEGSALNKLCANSNGQILLLHSRYESDMTQSIICGNGTIVGQSVRVENNSYTSHLTITVSPDIKPEDNIVCAHSHNGTKDIIGNATIKLQTGFPPPDKLYISAVDIGSSRLTVGWSPVSPDCPSIHYNIIASNCGSCPTTTNHTTVTCMDVPVNNDVCTFAVQTMHCGDLADNSANQSLTLNVTSTLPLREDCPVTFNVESSCGNCPTTTTNHTTVTCTNKPTDGSVCMFTMQALVCGSIITNASISMTPISNINEGNTYIIMNSSNSLGTIISTCVLAVFLIVGTAVSTTVILKSKVKVQAEVAVQQSGNIPNYEEISLDTNRNTAYGARVL